jgi:hypothetical protein
MQLPMCLLHLRSLNNEPKVHRVVDSVVREAFSKRLEERLAKSNCQKKLQNTYSSGNDEDQ